MLSEKLLLRRIKSAENISKVTKALERVATSKMKKAVDKAVKGAPYVSGITEMVTKLVGKIDPKKITLLNRSKGTKTLILLISSNKGLCGSLNSALFKKVLSFMEALGECDFLTLGKKGENLLLKFKKNIKADFSDISPATNSVNPLGELITDAFSQEEYKDVYIAFNRFVSALKYEPSIQKILPMESIVGASDNNKPLIEPSVNSLVRDLLAHYLETQIRNSIMSAEASEHSARMFAMKNASDSANDLISILTLEKNIARQQKITMELADIVTAREAIQ
ncbi:ATP synthase F1 subunit gamma [Candidatus Woesebacteria bacterium RIFCSPHIGHO2_01_FULL_39_28]|uniref:ATP synthase gamma chain n=1 Tax=Candidatus Woesebacteria bacterium RIFCSPHIGHO2_01_FULL_39_28 TaxID=1802496 RepID=A0A1F7YDL9_9BACT|nr:MAG: ATP synthase F1 subunit gamma [Candidatus Woesebacteria bacterium RIFCSPHIGHO2_01_FULL_39_28]OGM57545.1 MAG: ATP synthase F1 subunit gamma [Candidatus Woesebacteria bacterium RIFCSPLOWO2_01_FULL_38_20]